MTSRVEMVLTQCPDRLILRARDGNEQRGRSKQLVQWCRSKGIAPTLLEIETERMRRDPSKLTRPDVVAYHTRIIETSAAHFVDEDAL